MSATAKLRGRRIRFLAVDGRSNPCQSRLPFLQAIRDGCRAAAKERRPFDVVAGEFSTPSPSLGIDALEAQGYSLASRSSGVAWDHSVLAADLRHRSCLDWRGIPCGLLYPVQRSGHRPSRASRPHRR